MLKIINKPFDLLICPFHTAKRQYFLNSSIAEIKGLANAIKLAPFDWSLAFVLLKKGTEIINLGKEEASADEIYSLENILNTVLSILAEIILNRTKI